jgi:hypothetical protein
MNWVDRYQRQAGIAHFSEQAVERCLVGHGAAEQGFAVLPGDGQAFKPVLPLRGQVACDPDFVADGVCWCWFHECKYTGRMVLPGSNLSIVWSTVLGD